MPNLNTPELSGTLILEIFSVVKEDGISEMRKVKR